MMKKLYRLNLKFIQAALGIYTGCVITTTLSVFCSMACIKKYCKNISKKSCKIYTGCVGATKK